MENVLEQTVISGNLYGYSIDYYYGGKGVVIADSKKEATEKVISAYSEEYSVCEFPDLEVWEIEPKSLKKSPGVLEIFE